MRLGVNLTYRNAVHVAREAESLGYDLALAPEGYRSDAATVLGTVALRTRTIDLASGVFQIPARTPALTALTAATLDTLSGGRFRLGLGISNPDISEGWYGVPFDRPLGRTREYVEIVRRTLDRERVTYEGEHFQLPAPGCTATPLRLFTEPVRARVPIYLAAVGPRNLELTGEIADGWLGVFCTSESLARSVRHLRDGRIRAGREPDGFEVLPGLPVAVNDDLDAAVDAVRGYVAHFVGMGDHKRNFYYALAGRMGFEREAAAIHERYSAGDLRGAQAAVPAGFVDRVSLLGPVERIADRMREYMDNGATTLVVSPFATTGEGQAEILRAVAAARESLS
ncbi:LLM class F420-dependent oxidoreductase [Streptosporangium oxazolinicum]|uniref:LLM class F420-dependent oxidoreductase n=1 Tax=Streptosporangium oxazolinicum TaxID=909287 RepID=A0ABP8BD64_9ACTN